jgi:phosphoribosylglycinamide formyltransferase-1
VLVSGRGSNLKAILEAVSRGALPPVGLVLSNKPGCAALDLAEDAGAPTLALDPKRFDGREAYDQALVAELRRANVDLVCLAGFMRLLTPAALAAFPGRVLNIHPSLLPAFPGLHAQRQALESGVRLAGCTVHFVDAGVDTGAILAQAAVPVLPGDDEDALSARILAREHQVYPAAIGWVAAGLARLESGRVVWSQSPPSVPTGSGATGGAGDLFYPPIGWPPGRRA